MTVRSVKTLRKIKFTSNIFYFLQPKISRKFDLPKYIQSTLSRNIYLKFFEASVQFLSKILTIGIANLRLGE